MPAGRERVPLAKEAPSAAFSSFPDFSRINEECFNGIREDTFSTPRPASGHGSRGSGEKRWGMIDNMSVKDLLWVCDQTFAKTAKLLCTEMCENVRREFEEAKAQIRHDVVQPISALTSALDRLPSRLDGPLKRIIEAEVMPSLSSFSERVQRLDDELKAGFKEVELRTEQVEDLQRRAAKTCDKLLSDSAENTQDQLAQLRLLHSQMLDGSKSMTADMQNLLQASQDMHVTVEQKVDALLWKHTKEQPVKVDFSALPRGREEDSIAMQTIVEIIGKMDGTLETFDEKLQACFEHSYVDHGAGADRAGRAVSEGCDAMVQCNTEVAEAEVQASEIVVRKKRPARGGTTRNTQFRASRVSLAEVKHMRRNSTKKGVAVFADAAQMKRNARLQMTKTRYNVHDFYYAKGCAQYIARHAYFENAGSVMILLNCIWMAIDIDNNTAAVLVDADPLFIVVENVFCGFFVAELLIRFLAFEKKRNCCRDFWFVFDCFLNLYMVAETWVLSLVLLVGDMRGTEALFDASALRIIRMVKILRLSRMAKLLRAIPELSIVIKAVGAASRSMLVIAVFCLILVYLFALVMKQLTIIVNTEPTDSLASDFDSVLSVMNTLLLQCLFADNAQFVNEISAWHPIFWPCTMLFILMTSVTMMYMLVGVMVNVIEIVAASERESLQVSTVASTLRQAMKKLGVDLDGPIPKQSVLELVSEPEIINFLYGMDVDVNVLIEMLDLIFEDVLEKEGRPLHFGDLVETIMNMRGTNPATVQDVKASIRAVKIAMKNELSELRTALHSQFDTLTHQLRDITENENESSSE